MTSSSALGYSYEIDGEAHAEVVGTGVPSVFTSVVIEGLRTGDADLDGDGLIDMDELYEYVYEQLRSTPTHQTPTLDSKCEGKLYVATSVRGPGHGARPVPKTGRTPKYGPYSRVRPSAKWYLQRRTFIAAASTTLALGFGIPVAVNVATDPSPTGPNETEPQAHQPQRLLATFALRRGDDDLGGDIKFSPDSHVLAAIDDRILVRLWDVTTGTDIGALSYDDSIESMVFSPTNPILAVVGKDNAVKLWDITTRQQIAALPQSTVLLDGSSVAFSPDGRTMAITQTDETVRLWDVGTHQDAGVLTADQGTVL